MLNPSLASNPLDAVLLSATQTLAIFDHDVPPAAPAANDVVFDVTPTHSYATDADALTENLYFVPT